MAPCPFTCQGSVAVRPPRAIGLAGSEVDLAILANLASAIALLAGGCTVAATWVPDSAATLAGLALGHPPKLLAIGGVVGDELIHGGLQG